MVSFFPSFLSLSFDIYLYLHSFLSIIDFLPPQACLATLDWPSTLWQAAVSGLTPSSRRAAIQRLWQVQCKAIFSQATLVKKPFLKYRRWLYISDFGCKPDVQQKPWYDRVRFQIDPSLDIAGLVPAPRGPWSIITVMKFRVWSLPPPRGPWSLIAAFIFWVWSLSPGAPDPNNSPDIAVCGWTDNAMQRGRGGGKKKI